MVFKFVASMTPSTCSRALFLILAPHGGFSSQISLPSSLFHYHTFHTLHVQSFFIQSISLFLHLLCVFSRLSLSFSRTCKFFFSALTLTLTLSLCTDCELRIINDKLRSNLRYDSVLFFFFFFFCFVCFCILTPGVFEETNECRGRSILSFEIPEAQDSRFKSSRRIVKHFTKKIANQKI